MSFDRVVARGKRRVSDLGFGELALVCEVA